jgi:hypothetical protein
MKCTWKGCEKEGVIVLLDRRGLPWADLCDDHNQEFEEGLKCLNSQGEKGVRKVLRNWVLSHGGAEKMAKETVEETGFKKGINRVRSLLGNLEKGDK